VENIPGAVEKVTKDERDGKLRVLAPRTETVGVETFTSRQLDFNLDKTNGRGNGKTMLGSRRRFRF
jgi:hypothetical protein